MTDEKDPFDDTPEDLPPAAVVSVDGIIPNAARNCSKCGQPGRIVSNFAGRTGFCGPCKYDWPIGPPVMSQLPPIQGRGIRKQTVVEPDWSLASDEIE